MRVAAIADLHFGGERQDAERLERNQRLLDTLVDLDLKVLLVAGDLTTRARGAEFLAASRWLRSIDVPTLVIPGNHDLPYWNLVRRFGRPLSRFGRLFAWPDGAMLERDDALFVGGSSVVSWHPHLRWQDGRFARQELRRIEARFAGRGAAPGFKAFVSHHPVVPVAASATTGRPSRVAHRAARVLDILHRYRVELAVSGHEHLSGVRIVERDGWRLFGLSVPTALSHRQRGERNGFWTVDIEPGSLSFRLWQHTHSGRFAPQPVMRHARLVASNARS
ncbi:MAG: metallophosphoesterase [Gammaproteobacteria bacterium]|nr:metallophosphoesterase [Gammaproteobacteria bacterium]